MRFYLLIFLFSVAFCSSIDKIGPRAWLKVLNENEVAFIRQRCSPRDRLSTLLPKVPTTPTGKSTIEPSGKSTTPPIVPSGESTSDSTKSSKEPLPDIPPVTIINGGQVQDRVLGGGKANRGDFKHAVVFVSEPNTEIGREKEETLCSGTLISPWHVLTSRHCWDNLGKNTPGSEGHLLKYGGVCYAKGDDCDKNDMKTAELDFVIFDWDPEKGLRADLAIAQLTDQIPDEYFVNDIVDIACLPQIREATLPDEFQIVGWGLVNTDKEVKKTTRLHNVTVKTRIDCFGVEPINYGFCGAVDTEDEKKQGAGMPGDSGGGAVHWSEELGRFVVIGVQTMVFPVTQTLAQTIPVIKPKYKAVTKMISTSNYIDDMCQYLGLCGDKPYGFFPELQMGSVYLQNAARTLQNPLGPFRMISDTVNNRINEECRGTRKIIEKYLNGSIDPNNVVGVDDILVPPEENEEDDKCWAANKNGPSAYSFELVSNYKAFCALTAVTDTHFVTSRDCVKKAVKSIIKERKNVSYLASKIINRPWHVRHANEEDDEVQSRSDDKNYLRPVEMIAWSNLPYGLSIVQLANNSQLAARDVNFACLQHTEEVLPQINVASLDPKKRGDNPLLHIPRIFFDLFRSDDEPLNEAASEADLDEADFSYGVVKKCNDTQKYLCAKKSKRKISEECLKKLRKRPAKKTKQRLDGHGIYDLYRYAFVGIQLANEELKTVGWEMYLAAKAFSGTLCIFLNRCESDSHTFNSAVDYFSDIYTYP